MMDAVQIMARRERVRMAYSLCNLSDAAAAAAAAACTLAGSSYLLPAATSGVHQCLTFFNASIAMSSTVHPAITKHNEKRKAEVAVSMQLMSPPCGARLSRSLSQQ
jgi:hypothetical protein